jgi:hypothetical protein
VTFLAPWYLVAAGALAASVVVLHYLVMRQPPRDILPTVRFIPQHPAIVRTWNRRPDHLLVLALRTAALLLIGAAFARPVWHRHRVRVAHIVLADRSRAVNRATEVGDSVRHVETGSRDVVIPFDSTPSRDSSLTRQSSRGDISAALIAGLRAASHAESVAESVEVVLVSPAVGDEIDAATDSIRALWPGAIRLVPVTAHRDSAPTAGHLTLIWPDTSHPRASLDTTSAVVASNTVVVAPFARRWGVDTAQSTVVARWVDGEPAAIEQQASTGCTRRVVVPVSTAGDLTVRPEFIHFSRLMHSACGAMASRRGGEWSTDTTRPARVRSRRAGLDGGDVMAWLVAGAIALLVAELVVRRTQTP